MGNVPFEYAMPINAIYHFSLYARLVFSHAPTAHLVQLQHGDSLLQLEDSSPNPNHLLCCRVQWAIADPIGIDERMAHVIHSRVQDSWEASGFSSEEEG